MVMDWINGLLDGTLFTGSIFFLIGVVGAVLLLIGVLLDGVFDFFDFGDGPLSLTTIAAFTTIFGFASFGFIGAGVSAPLSGMFGALAGLLGGAFAWWLSRSLRSEHSNTAVSTSTLTGSEAVVILAIPEGGRLGEVALTRHGERFTLSATANEAIPRGARVRITAMLTATSVTVEPMTADDQPSNDPAGSTQL